MPVALSFTKTSFRPWLKATEKEKSLAFASDFLRNVYSVCSMVMVMMMVMMMMMMMVVMMVVMVMRRVSLISACQFDTI